MTYIEATSTGSQPSLTAPGAAKAGTTGGMGKGIVIGAVAVLATLCLCCIPFFALGSCVAVTRPRYIGYAGEVRDQVMPIIDEFMELMSDKDTEAAYGLLSAHAQHEQSFAQFEEWVEGADYVLFDGYESMEITSCEVDVALIPGCGELQASVAEVQGTVVYEGSFAGTFQARLERENGVWKIGRIHITVPPSKYSDQYSGAVQPAHAADGLSALC